MVLFAVFYDGRGKKKLTILCYVNVGVLLAETLNLSVLH